MSSFFVIATVDNVQVFRVLLAWSTQDADLRARYLWRDQVISSLEILEPLDIVVPDDFEP
jgi:hypothetical protein